MRGLLGAIGREIGPREKRVYQEVIDPTGEKSTHRMTRLGTNGRCTADFGNKIIQLRAGGKLVQVGWVGWRKITAPEGTHLAIVMTKSMAKGARWAGRYDDTLYKDR